jgi:hypothetical protein
MQTALVLGALLLGISGCSNDKPTDADGNDDAIPGVYALAGWIGGDMAPGGFRLAVSRLEPEAISAMEADVTLNGQPVPLRPDGSTPAGAHYALATLDYEAGETCTILASIGGRTAACSFTGPAYPPLTLTAPPDAFEFHPGDSIALAWIYAGGAPDSIHIAATGDDAHPVMDTLAIAGADTSYTIPGALTANWADAGEILITVDEGKARFPFTGTLAAAGSEVMTAGRGDSVGVHPGSGVRVTVGSGGLPQIDWDPALPMFALLVRQTGGFGTLRWWLAPPPSGSITPPVTYGTVPPGVFQIFPLSGAPAALTAGTSYQIVLIDAGADTTLYTFTHAGD